MGGSETSHRNVLPRIWSESSMVFRKVPSHSREGQSYTLILFDNVNSFLEKRELGGLAGCQSAHVGRGLSPGSAFFTALNVTGTPLTA